MAKGYSYSRAGNPTVSALQDKMNALEGGAGTTAYATGMAATVSVMMSFLNAGDHAIVSDVVYGGTHRFATKVLARFGVDFDFVDTSDLAAVERSVRPSTRLIFTETPANPTLKLTDLRAVSEIARAAGVIHAVDNTFLTPYYQRPLELGADLSVHSTTKYLEGHNATLGGAVVAADLGHHEQLKFMQKSAGSIMSPMVAWLTLQGVKTLSDRMDRQTDNALQVARFLEDAPGSRDRRLSGPRELSAARPGQETGERVWSHGLVRSAGRPQGRNETDALGSSCGPWPKTSGRWSH